MPNEISSAKIPEIDPTEMEDSRSLPNAQHHSFLEKVMVKGGLADLYDARTLLKWFFARCET